MNKDRSSEKDAVLRWQKGRERAQRYKQNRKRYTSQPLEALRSAITPYWSDKPDDLKRNLSDEKFFPQGYTLLSAPLDTVLFYMHDDNYFDQGVLFPPQRNEQTIIEVLAEWEAKLALTPPIVQSRDDRIAFNDGMHRFTVACLLKSEEIPLYVKREDEPWFIKLPGVKVIGRGEWPTRTLPLREPPLTDKDGHEQEDG